MARRKRTGLGGRYDLAKVVASVEAYREALGLSVKEAAARCGWSEFDWYKKRDLENPRSTFSVEELGRVADAFDAPPGWPFLSLEQGRALEKALAPPALPPDPPPARRRPQSAGQGVPKGPR